MLVKKYSNNIFHFQGQEICRVYCGAQFSLALSKSGALFTWGKGDNHRLGHNSEEHVRYPKQVKGLAGEEFLYFFYWAWGDLDLLYPDMAKHSNLDDLGDAAFCVNFGG